MYLRMVYLSYSSDKEETIEKGWLIKIFNRFEERDDYEINFDYYITQCYKIINVIETRQYSLF